MNEEEKTGRAIAKLLNDNLHDVTPGTLYRLKTARRAALEHYQPAEKIIHAGAGISARNGYHWFPAHAGRLLLTASLLLVLVVHGYWQKHHRVEDKSITVPSILTNDSSAGSQEIEDVIDDDIAADKEASSRETNNGSDYGDETGAVIARSVTDSGEAGDSPDAIETQDPENATEEPYPYADGDDQDSAAEENAGAADNYPQDSEDTADFYDEENTRDTTDTSNTLAQ